MIGGEDYGLLGACRPAALDALLAAVPLARHVGRVTEDAGIVCNGRSMTELQGFDHFAS
jgi:thiamine-monophosphate kinase